MSGSLVDRWLWVTSVLLGLPLCGCGSDLSSTDADPRGRLFMPTRGGFEIVADALQVGCGTLDCHGQTPRNMRTYGQFGLRLRGEDDPLTQPTHADEYDATYASICGLEPEAMSRVATGTTDPVHLSMVRKARGIEQHKGGKLQTAGDALDNCTLGWLVGKPAPKDCEAVVENRHPYP